MSDFTDYEANDYDESGEDYADAFDNDESWDVDPEDNEEFESLDEDESEEVLEEEDSEETEYEDTDEVVETEEDEIFPNGYTRRDYLNKGFTDNDIATWGLDQNAAPRPDIARLMILDLLDDYLGKKKDRPDHGNDDLNIFRR